VKDFDLHALGKALDARRAVLGRSWSQVAAELGVSVPTLRQLGNRPTAEGDGVLRILAWLGVGPNDAAFGGGERNSTAPGSPRKLRFDTAALYAALDGARGARGLTWREVGAACGVASAAALTRLKRGGRTSYPTVARVLTWIGPPANRFVRIDSR